MKIKKCRKCKTTIPARAKVCPYCFGWQWRNTLIVLFIVLLISVAVSGFVRLNVNNEGRFERPVTGQSDISEVPGNDNVLERPGPVEVDMKDQYDMNSSQVLSTDPDNGLQKEDPGRKESAKSEKDVRGPDRAVTENKIAVKEKRVKKPVIEKARAGKEREAGTIEDIGERTAHDVMQEIKKADGVIREESNDGETAESGTVTLPRPDADAALPVNDDVRSTSGIDKDAIDDQTAGSENSPDTGLKDGSE